ncbi:MAG: DUF4115 domain-containing protein [Anaerolineae bacterium]|nr:DUF4115 domain-containing protein [Anaerolineae bacterium]
MDTLGVWLRNAREAMGSTLEDAEAATRIRSRFLEALEAGDFVAFPGGEVQIRGFLRIYARYLGLSPEEAVARYEAEVRGMSAVSAAQLAPATPALAANASGFSSPSVALPRRIGFGTFMLFGVSTLVLLISVVIAIYFAGNRELLGKGVLATAFTRTPAPADTLPAPTQTLPTPTPTFPVNPQGGVSLALEATEHVWVRVSADGANVFEGMLFPGQPMAWSARELISVETGNGAGVQVTVNGQRQGTMCGRDEVCTRAWSPLGEVPAPAMP